MDAFIYLAHAIFWGAFFLGRCVLKFGDQKESKAPVARSSGQERVARFSKSLVFVHFVALSVMYWGIGLGVFSGHNPHWIPAQRTVGFLVIASAGALVCWAIASFRSWRFRAKLTEGHELATGGPFRVVRHPIYLGLDLFALGSVIWLPNAMVIAGFALMIISGDLRARAEEKLMCQVFGEAYREYCERTCRFLPGVY